MASNRKFSIIKTFDGKTFKLPKVKMTNGITVSLFDPYRMEHARGMVEALDYYFRQKIMTGDWAAIVVPATKPIPLAWYFAYRYNLGLVVLKKERKPYHTKVRSFTCKSITSDYTNTMFITEDEYQQIKGKDVIFFDDVLSTGMTYRGSKRFLKTVCQCKKVESIFCFKEGTSYKEGKEVSYCGNLPLELPK